jgi:signal transduction histidine kinase
MPLTSQHIDFYTHALRTPLQTVRGLADLIAPDLPEAKLQRYTAGLRQDVLRLTRLVEDLTLHNELAGADFPLWPEPTRLPPLLFELAHTFQEHFPQHRLQLKFPHTLPVVLADASRLRQVLWHLLASAAQATPRRAGGVQVLITAHAGLKILVRDGGPRVPRRYHRMIFEPITHWPLTLRRSPHAQRWGLAAARQLAHKLGGEISIVSTATASPHGQAFIFYLPLEQNDD